MGNEADPTSSNLESRASGPDWNIVRRRAQLLARLREAFAALNFLEVDTPLLSRDTVVDRHLDPLAVRVARRDELLWLQTSPEFAMKRLLADAHHARPVDDPPAAIFQICKAFRDDEHGPLHNVEFTMIEWYRIGDDLAAGMTLLDELQQLLLSSGSAERLSYREAFRQHAEFDPLTTPAEQLPGIATAAGVAAPASLGGDHDGWLDLLMVELVAPNLGIDRPTILYDYPVSQAALAQIRDDNPPVAERFELFYRGIELANGYHELTDPDVLRARNRAANNLRRGDGKPTLPEESQLLTAMERGLPPCSGCALGFDRALMLAVGAATLDDIIVR